ncbi:MAG: PEP-CTERM sorting domain-containing protein [Verrucomicrobia bacterium]|nr:PEP-CTERM sorting domain-containing protein [Verrucomicrobiota bacterium]
MSTAIPDNDDAGFVDTRAVSIPGMELIADVTVTLNFTGGWNGDLYAYLVHGGGFAVLLNRPGRSLTSTDGSATVGMDITFSDSAPSDVHTAIPMSGGSVSGTYQPDSREADPLAVLDTAPRTAFLSNFAALDPNGTWSIFVADQSPGETSTLQSWSLNITTVPEPSSALFTLLSTAVLLRRRRNPKL